MKTGWWFGTFFIFPYIGNNHPNWLIFFRGVQTTNQKISIQLLFEIPFDLMIHEIPTWRRGLFHTESEMLRLIEVADKEPQELVVGVL